MIRTTWTIARRELAAFFFSPIAYGIATLVVGVNGAMFYIALNALDGDLSQSVSILYGWLVAWFLSILVPPLLTMRLFSEEKRSGTIETLMTAPVSDAGIVLGKYVAAVAYYTMLWAPTLLYFVVLRALDANPDPGLFASCFLGTVLCGVLFLAIGLFASACTSNQVLAASAAVVLNLVLFFLPLAAYAVTKPNTRELLDRYSIMSIFQTTFMNGLVDSVHVVYFVSLAGFFLFVTIRVVEARKWK